MSCWIWVLRRMQENFECEENKELNFRKNVERSWETIKEHEAISRSKTLTATEIAHEAKFSLKHLPFTSGIGNENKCWCKFQWTFYISNTFPPELLSFYIHYQQQNEQQTTIWRCATNWAHEAECCLLQVSKVSLTCNPTLWKFIVSFFFFSMLVEALISRCKTNEARWTLCIEEKTHTHATQFTSKRAAIISRVDRQPCIDMRSMCGDCNQKFICTQYCN